VTRRCQPRTLAVCLLLTTLLACGLKTAPRPMEDTAPLVPSAPRVVVSEGGEISVSWQRAEHSHDGARLYDLAGFSIERDSGGGFEEIARVTVNDNQRIRPQRDFEARDDQALPGRLSYRVRAFLADGQRGQPSPASSITLPAH